jgi:hypothetical protein
MSRPAPPKLVSTRGTYDSALWSDRHEIGTLQT